jgi:hypothetical protein
MSQARLLTQRKFYPLFWTQFFGAFNDNFLKNALVILIAFRTSSVLGIPASEMVVVAGGVFILPFFLFSATAGQLADKYEKSRMIRWIKLAEIAIMALAALGLALEAYPLLLFTLFLMGLHSTFFGPVKYSILPQHLDSGELVGGNALVEAGTFLAILLGTIAGGVLVSIPGTGPLLVGAGLVAAAVAGYLACRKIPEAPPVDPAIRVQWNPVPPTFEIYRFTRKNRAVFLSILGISWFWLFGAALLSLFPAYCKDTLGAGEGVVTLFLAVFSIGIGVGSLLCERLSRERLELGLVPLGSIGMTGFALDLCFRAAPAAAGAPLGAGAFLATSAGAWIVADLFLLSVFSGFFIVPLYTLIQERSEKSHRSRIIAANNVLNALFMVLSSGLLVALMRLGLDVPRIFLVLALLNGAAAIYIYSLLPEFLLRFIAWMIANVMYRMRVTGERNIPKEGPAVLVCNHVSFVDWLVIGAAVKRPIRFVMDTSYAKGWLVGPLLRQAKVIPIVSAKVDPKLMNEAFEKVAAELREGELVCIFPEGAITRDGKLAGFRPGIERILRETPVPVVPLALAGLWGSFFSREGGRAILKWPKRFWSRIGVRIGEPVAPALASVDALRERVAGLLQ